MDLSIVVPIKDEQDNLIALHERISAAVAPLGKSYEIVLVDDGSVDGSHKIMLDLARRDPCLKVVRLRRNFGQSASMQAGIDHASGAVIVTMDGDLQNDPADIPMLLEKLDEGEGCDAVVGQRANRQDKFFLRKVPSAMGNWLIRKVTGVNIKDLGCTLRAMRRDTAQAIPLYGEMHRFIPVLLQQSGAKIVQVPVRHHPRTAGKTKYTLSRTFRVLVDLITVKFLHSYLTRPMHAMGLAGLFAMGLGFVSLVVTICMKYFGNTFMTGNPFLLLSALLVLIGVQLIATGLVGEMMSRTYFESQGKKSYTVRETHNLEETQQRKAA